MGPGEETPEAKGEEDVKLRIVISDDAVKEIEIVVREEDDEQGSSPHPPPHPPNQ